MLAQVDPADLVGLASALIRIPSFKTEETPVARFLAPFFRERDYRVELQEVEPGRLYVGGANVPGCGPSRGAPIRAVYVSYAPLMATRSDPRTVAQKTYRPRG